MNYSTGYKQMLRDRCPETTNYALKWQKSKEKWLNHAYRNFIRIYCDSKERYYTTRIILGLAKGHREFNFDKSIDWDNLTPEEINYWNRVSSWVRWFAVEYESMKNTYFAAKASNKDELSIKIELINAYLKELMPSSNMTEEEKQAKYKYIDALVDFLIKCFEHALCIFNKLEDV